MADREARLVPTIEALIGTQKQMLVSLAWAVFGRSASMLRSNRGTLHRRGRDRRISKRLGTGRRGSFARTFARCTRTASPSTIENCGMPSAGSRECGLFSQGGFTASVPGASNGSGLFCSYAAIQFVLTAAATVPRGPGSLRFRSLAFTPLATPVAGWKPAIAAIRLSTLA